MIRRLIAAAILLALTLFVVIDVGVLLVRVAEAEGLIELSDEAIDTY